MHKITISASVALSILVLSTARLAEIRDGREFRKYGPSRIPPLVELLDGPSSCILLLEAHIYIADEVIANIVANDHFLDGTVAGGEFEEHVLVEEVKVLLQLGRCQDAVGVMGRIQINVRDEQGDGIVGLDMLAATLVAVTTGPYFVVKGAVDSSKGVQKTNNLERTCPFRFHIWRQDVQPLGTVQGASTTIQAEAPVSKTTLSGVISRHLYGCHGM